MIQLKNKQTIIQLNNEKSDDKKNIGKRVDNKFGIIIHIFKVRQL